MIFHEFICVFVHLLYTIDLARIPSTKVKNEFDAKYREWFYECDICEDK